MQKTRSTKCMVDSMDQQLLPKQKQWLLTLSSCARHEYGSGQCAPDWCYTCIQCSVQVCFYPFLHPASSPCKCHDWSLSFLNQYTYYFQRHNVPAPPHVANMSRFCGKCRTIHMVDLCACKVTNSTTYWHSFLCTVLWV